MTMDRPTMAAETAAVLAAASVFYREVVGDATAADEALAHAEELFALADGHRWTYVDSIPNAGDFYKYVLQFRFFPIGFCRDALHNEASAAGAWIT